jgi:hypothetical protein
MQFAVQRFFTRNKQLNALHRFGEIKKRRSPPRYGCAPALPEQLGRTAPFSSTVRMQNPKSQCSVIAMRPMGSLLT